MTLMRRPGVAVVTLLFLLVGAAFLTQLVPYRQIIDSQRQVNASRAELNTLLNENAQLQADIAALSTPAEIERIAREKLGYTFPGETSYVVLDPPPEERTPVPSFEIPVLPEERTWVDKFWDFLTGADIESEG